MIFPALDCDQSLASLAPRIRASGRGAVGRYLGRTPRAEIDALHKAGVAVWLYYERSARRALEGAAAGATDGETAAQLLTVLGAPPEVAAYLTVDFGEVVGEDAVVMSYFRAVRAIMIPRRMGVYAEGAVCRAARDGRVADYTCLAGGSRMRGTPEFLASGEATIVQTPTMRDSVLGIDVDPCWVRRADFGGWLPEGWTAPLPRTLTVGMGGEDVREMQRILLAKGYDVGDAGADGAFGHDTAAAVSAFRVAAKLPDGEECDPAMWAAIS